MSDEIIKLLDDLGQRFGIAIDWSSQNVVPYLQDFMSRYINYEIITSIVWLIVLVVCCTGMVIAIPRLIKYERECNESDCVVWPTVVVVFFMAMIILCLIGIGSQINDLIICNTIPEKMIIDYVNYLVSYNGQLKKSMF